MKRKKQYILGIVIVLLLIFIYLNLQKKGVIGKSSKYIKDFDYVYNCLEESYPQNYIQDQSEWFRRKEEFQELVKDSKNDEDFFHKMEYILSEFKDSHVYMISKTGYLLIYPCEKDFREYQYKKEEERDMKYIFNLETARAYEISEEELKEACKETEEIGRKTIEGDNLITGEIIPGKVAYLEVKTMRPLTDGRKEDMKEEEKLFDFLRKIKNHQVLVIDLRRNPGGYPHYSTDFLLPCILGNTDYKQTNYYFIRNRKYEDRVGRTFFFDKKVTKEKMVMLKSKIPALKDPKVLNYIENNFEGYQTETYKLANSPEPSLAFPGKIYVLIDNQTASASDQMARMVKLNQIGTLVGRKTGGEGSVYTKYLRLPNTNFLMYTVAGTGLVEGLNLDDTIATTPDIEVKNGGYNIYGESENADYGEDKDIQKILEIEGY